MRTIYEFLTNKLYLILTTKMVSMLKRCMFILSKGLSFRYQKNWLIGFLH